MASDATSPDRPRPLREISAEVLVAQDQNAAAFAWFPNSIGVANVAEHLHRLPIPPAFVTVKERGKGFAEVAETIFANQNHGDHV